jgi:hypothetical protein
VSAILHEYCVSVPLRIFKAYAFIGMALQVTKNHYSDAYAFIGMALQLTKNDYCDAYAFIGMTLQVINKAIVPNDA